MIVKNTFKNTDVDIRKDKQAEIHRKCILLLQQAGG